MSETMRHEVTAAATTVGGVRFIGTATTLITYRGLTLLTDPNFVLRGRRVSLGYGLWTKRRSNPAMTIDQLPWLDAVVLSHLHGDHFDRVARHGLDHEVPLFTTSQAARRLGRWKFEAVQPMRTWQQQEVGRGSTSVAITALPAVHARGVLGRVLPETMGTMLEFVHDGQTELRMYITGDSLYGDHMAEIVRRFPHIDVALLHLGGTKLAGVLISMDGAQGADAVQLIKPALALPIHNDDYPVFRSLVTEFEAEIGRRTQVAGSRVVVLDRGQEQPLSA